MLQRIKQWSVVLVLVFVIGAHWALLQSAAWVGMTVKFARTDSITVALQKTFDGEHPCAVCKMVKEGKASERKQELQKTEGKFEFFTAAGACELFPPGPIRHFTPVPEQADASRAAPLLQPPRLA